MNRRRKTAQKTRRLIRRADEFDPSLLAANLRLTPHERMLQHDRALHLGQVLRQAMEARHARS